MTPVEFIIAKRDGYVHPHEDIQQFIRSFTAGDVADYQMAAWLMAVYFRGMTREETKSLIVAMRDSGQVMDLSGLDGAKIDKHSTGGVGDKTSIILAPLLASLGVRVPMISGRGLGHTGGTLDKLESIPGFNVRLEPEQFLENLKTAGAAMIGQTNAIAPADRAMYAIRDVTGTVESIPLICGSILSKKLASGIDALVLDIKTGSGAFMATEEKSIELAQWLVSLACDLGTETIALITDMNQPLGRAVGNWLEIRECLETLNGAGPSDLRRLSVALGACMLRLAHTGMDWKEAIVSCERQLDNGKALARLYDLTRLQGGDVSVLQKPESYSPSRYQWQVTSSSDGWITAIDTRSIGITGVLINAGRKQTSDSIDPRAGFIIHKKIGDAVEKGEPICTIHSSYDHCKDEAMTRIRRAFHIGETAVAPPPLIKHFMDRHGIQPHNPFSV